MAKIQSTRVSNDELDQLETSIIRAISRGIVWLLGSQNSDGGWGEGRGQPSDVFPSYLGVWALSEAGLGQTDWSANAQAQFNRTRTLAGGWGAEFSSIQTIDPTARGLLSIFRRRRLGKRFVLSGKDMQAVAFILDARLQSGAWPRDLTGQYRGARTGVHVSLEGDVGATLPFIDVLAMIPEDRRSPEVWTALQEGITWVKSLVNSDGGCGHVPGTKSDPLAAAWALRALNLAFGEQTVHERQSLGRYLLTTESSGQWHPLGESSNSLLCTYNAVHSLVRNGSTLSDDAVQSAVKWLLARQRKDGCWGAEGAAGSTHYTASLILVLSQVSNSRSAHHLAVLQPLVQALRKLDARSDVLEISRRFALYASRNVVLMIVFLAISLLAGIVFEVWTRLPSGTRNVVLTGMILAIFANLVAAFIYDRLKRRRS